MVEHSEKYNFVYQLPYDYNPAATCQTFNDFLKSSLNDNDLIKVIGEYLGFVLNHNTKKHEKALFIWGDGSNGKSTLINICKALFGNENISHVELTEMGDSQKCALMDGKLLNISSDAKKKGLDTSAFKKIVSEEPVLGRFLFKDLYTIENLPKLIVAMNKLPLLNGDTSHGMYRRLLLVPFTRIIKEKEKNYNLESDVTKNELPGILNFAIEGMIRLTKQGKFTEAKSMTEVINNYKEASNHVSKFIEEEQYESLDPALKKGTALTKIYTDFKAWCSLHDFSSYNSTYLSAELEHMGFISYKNSTKHYRIIKKKLENKTTFKTFEEHNNHQYYEK